MATATSLWNRSGDQQRDKNGEIAKEAFVEFFRGGTTTPLVVYSDSGANTSLGSKVTVDGNGFWPAIFVPTATGNPYGYRVRAADNTNLFFADNILNPSVEEAGGAPPPPTFETGDTTFRFVDGTLDGWVRLNGRTIGSENSTATERANDDTVNLYTYLWNNLADAQAPVIGGRGGSPASDFAANKPLTLPDFRAGGPIGIDGMGGDDSGEFINVPFVHGNAGTIGSLGGYNTKVVATSEIEAHFHTINTLKASTTDSRHQHDFSTVGDDGTHNHVVALNAAQGNFVDGAQSGAGGLVPSSFSNQDTVNEESTHGHSGTTNTEDPKSEHEHELSGQMGSVGGGNPRNVVHKSTLVTYYIKL